MADAAENTYNTRPSFHQKFKPSAVKVLISTVMSEKLADKTYSSETAAQWSREISDEVKARCAQTRRLLVDAASVDAGLACSGGELATVLARIRRPMRLQAAARPCPPALEIAPPPLAGSSLSLTCLGTSWWCRC